MQNSKKQPEFLIKKLKMKTIFSTLKCYFTTLFFSTLLSIVILGCEQKQTNNTNNFSTGQAGDTITVRTYKHDKGWGYEVLIGKKVFIKQECVPAVDGSNGFSTEEKAYKTACLVAEKLSEGNSFPSVTIEELDSLGVLKPN